MKSLWRVTLTIIGPEKQTDDQILIEKSNCDGRACNKMIVFSKNLERHEEKIRSSSYQLKNVLKSYLTRDFSMNPSASHLTTVETNARTAPAA